MLFNLLSDNKMCIKYYLESKMNADLLFANEMCLKHYLQFR